MGSLYGTGYSGFSGYSGASGASGLDGTTLYSHSDFRLTLASENPVPTTNQDAKTTIYLTPHVGNQITLWDGTTWGVYDSDEMELYVTHSRNGTTTNGSPVITGLSKVPPAPYNTASLVVGMKITGTGIPANSVITSINSVGQVTMNNNATVDGTNSLTFKAPGSNFYDLFVVDLLGLGTPFLVYGPAWSGETTRSTSLTTKDGVYTLSGAFSVAGTSYAEGRLKYVGTIRTTNNADGQCEDSFTSRYVWNLYNKVARWGFTCNTNSSWTYSTYAWREANGGSGQLRFNFVLGLPQPIFVSVHGEIVNSTGTSYLGVSIDATNSASGGYFATALGRLVSGKNLASSNLHYLSTGYHYATISEIVSGGTTTAYGYGTTTAPGYGSMILLEN